MIDFYYTIFEVEKLCISHEIILSRMSTSFDDGVRRDGFKIGSCGKRIVLPINTYTDILLPFRQWNDNATNDDPMS